MFGWVDFREDGKKRVENRRENGWELCLDERGTGREKWWGPAIFSLGPPQFNLSKMKRKWGRKGGRVYWTKLPFSIPCQLFVFPAFFLAWIKPLQVCTVRSRWFWFWFFFFFWIKFCTVDVGSFCLFLSVFFFKYSFTRIMDKYLIRKYHTQDSSPVQDSSSSSK